MPHKGQQEASTWHSCMLWTLPQVHNPIRADCPASEGHLMYAMCKHATTVAESHPQNRHQPYSLIYVVGRHIDHCTIDIGVWRQPSRLAGSTFSVVMPDEPVNTPEWKGRSVEEIPHLSSRSTGSSYHQKKGSTVLCYYLDNTGLCYVKGN